MLSSGIIDLAIGLAFAFGVTAALASVITELISRFLGLRGAYLLKGLRELLDGTGVETVVNEADRDYDAMKGLVTGSIAPGTDVKIPVGPPPPTADATPPAPGTPSPTTTPDASTKPARPVQMRAMSATGALLGSPILRSQGMTGDISNRDLVLKASRFGPGVTGGSWRKPVRAAVSQAGPGARVWSEARVPTSAISWSMPSSVPSPAGVHDRPRMFLDSGAGFRYSRAFGRPWTRRGIAHAT